MFFLYPFILSVFHLCLTKKISAFLSKHVQFSYSLVEILHMIPLIEWLPMVEYPLPIYIAELYIVKIALKNINCTFFLE